MDAFCEAAGARLVAGIPARYWRRFFKMFTETATNETVETMLTRFAQDVGRTWKGGEGNSEEIASLVRQLARRLV